MINSKNLKKYCCDDISLIENYNEAINDQTQTWECHHRLETELGLTPKQLIDIERYYNVPAYELILLTNYEHNSIHKRHSGKKHTEETKRKMSESHKGIESPNKGKKTWNKGLKNCFSEETLLKKSESIKGRYRIYRADGSYYYSKREHFD